MKYELTINLIKGPSMGENHPIHKNIVVNDEIDLKKYLMEITQDGLLIDDGYSKKYIPGHKIDNIEIDIIEEQKN